MVCNEWINFHLTFMIIDKFGWLCVVILFRQKSRGWVAPCHAMPKDMASEGETQKNVGLRIL